MRLFAASLPGLEELLAIEIATLTDASLTIVPGGVEIDGDDDAIYRLALGSGLASHLTLRIGMFRARRFEALVRETRALPWSDWIPEGEPVAVRVRCKKSRLHHTGAIEERVLRAIAESRGGESVDAEKQPVSVSCRIVHDEVTLSLDLTGAPLFKRGYRQATAKAPLREDLARALLLLSGWDPSTPLLDPFCGSGTIAIEAARMALGILPGGDRSFDFERTPRFDRARFDAVRAELATRFEESRKQPTIHAADRDAGAVTATRDNAARAGVADRINVHHAPLGKVPFFRAPGRRSGAVVTNPPHGKRIGDPKALRSLYQSLGARLAELPSDYIVALLVRDARVARTVGVDLANRLTTTQGGSKVRVLVGSTSGPAGSDDA